MCLLQVVGELAQGARQAAIPVPLLKWPRQQAERVRRHGGISWVDLLAAWQCLRTHAPACPHLVCRGMGQGLAAPEASAYRCTSFCPQYSPWFLLSLFAGILVWEEVRDRRDRWCAMENVWCHRACSVSALWQVPFLWPPTACIPPCPCPTSNSAKVEMQSAACS